jgi:hypothetical protein
MAEGVTSGVESTGLFLAGTLAPVGLSVSFLRRPMNEVRAAILTWRKRELKQTIEETGPARLRDCVSLLDPFEAPWTMEVLIDSGEWTTYLNNGIDGGDPTAAAPYLGTRLRCDCLVATHTPLSGPGHASTQLWLMGPSGEPPLMHVRTIAAHAEDGRWSWMTNGPVQPFEKPKRYEARRVRDRFDRVLLVEYLFAIGIHVDDPAFYGNGFGLRQIVSYERRRETSAQVRARFGW